MVGDPKTCHQHAVMCMQPQLKAANTVMAHSVSPTQVITYAAAGNDSSLAAHLSFFLTYSKKKIKVAIFETPTERKVTFMRNVDI